MANRCAGNETIPIGLVSRLVRGFRLADSRYDGRRSRVSPSASNRAGGIRGPTARRSIRSRGALRKEAHIESADSASVDEEVDRACQRVTERVSEVDTVW